MNIICEQGACWNCDQNYFNPILRAKLINLETGT